ncbi:hypothetical protein [Sutterella massiliensis]|nr:hypothetical protein [Sutterella massiliensis]
MGGIFSAVFFLGRTVSSLFSGKVFSAGFSAAISFGFFCVESSAAERTAS